MKRLYLIRHGLVHNPHGVSYGKLPGFHLGDVGRAEAAAAARFMAGVPYEIVWHSPLERAVETAEIVNAGRDVPTAVQDLLIEYDGIEPAEASVERMRTFWRLWREAPQQSAVAVSHRDPIRFLLLDLAGHDPEREIGDLSLFPLDTAGVYCVDGVDEPRIEHLFEAQAAMSATP